MEALNAFEDWSVSYHGVSSSVVLKSILDCGQLMKAGDTLLDGTKLWTVWSVKCAGREDKLFYTSPTVHYAGKFVLYVQLCHIVTLASFNNDAIYIYVSHHIVTDTVRSHHQFVER